DGVSVTTIRSTLRRTKSAASSGMRSVPLFSANRYSMVKFFPSIHPSLLSSSRKAFTRTALPEAVLGSRKPMRKTFPGCCAWAEKQSAKNMALRLRTVIFFFMRLSLAPPLDPRHLTLDSPSSLNHFIRPIQYRLWNRHADLFRRFQIDDE